MMGAAWKDTGFVFTITIGMTVDTYGHIGDAQVRTAADAMDAALGKVVTSGSRSSSAVSSKTSTKTS
jgi:hypothetical protein